MAEFVVQGALTAAGRPSLQDGETQVAVAGKVVVSDGGKREIFRGKSAMVSTHFVWVVLEDGTGAKKLPLQRVLKAQVHNSMFRREKYLEFFFASDPSRPLLRIVFANGSESAEFHARLQTSMERQGWKTQPKVVQRQEQFSTQLAGIGGIVRRQEQEREQTSALTDTAFSDLEALLKSASEIVALTDRFSATLRRRAQQQAKNDGDQKEEDDFFAILNDMGIANPATKKACGSRYHEELARELADFLNKNLQKHARSGVIALTDLYCLVNRARGTQLVSPNDLFQACSMMSSLNLNYELKTFSSGVSVVQHQSHSDKAVADQICKLLETQNYVTALTVAQHTSQSLQLCQEQLSTTEKMGLLCRDETPHGIHFYQNRFPGFVE